MYVEEIWKANGEGKGGGGTEVKGGGKKIVIAEVRENNSMVYRESDEETIVL